VLAIIFMLLIALGFVTKTMPQINVLSVGFTVKILFGITMIALSLTAMHGAAADEIERVLGLALRWARSL
jgi:flagellar biosynthetic protein FliR